MSVDYRPFTADDLEQAAHLEAVAFYETPTPERLDLLRKHYPPDWTLGAFVDGKLVADVRTIPMARRMNGDKLPIGAVGPVCCLAQYRRQGHVGRLLTLSLERMREQGQALSGLHTPHDALYARYGWERAEAKKHYAFAPKDVSLRLRGRRPGKLETASADDWPRLDAVYREYAQPRNGPLHRNEVWWREALLRDYSGPPKDRDAFVWVGETGRDEGYVVYLPEALPRERGHEPQDIFVRDFVSLTSDAYLGLWSHLLTHDLARRVVIEVAPDDPLPDLTVDPWKIAVTRGEGAMLRIVDVERALTQRPYRGERAASFTMRVTDTSAPWNDGVWRVEVGEGRMRAERASGEADMELSANTLAPVFTGYMRPEVAAGVGLLTINREDALREMTEAFSVTYPPFCNDYY